MRLLTLALILIWITGTTGDIAAQDSGSPAMTRSETKIKIENTEYVVFRYSITTGSGAAGMPSSRFPEIFLFARDLHIFANPRAQDEAWFAVYQRHDGKGYCGFYPDKDGPKTYSALLGDLKGFPFSNSPEWGKRTNNVLANLSQASGLSVTNTPEPPGSEPMAFDSKRRAVQALFPECELRPFTQMSDLIINQIAPPAPPIDPRDERIRVLEEDLNSARDNKDALERQLKTELEGLGKENDRLTKELNGAKSGRIDGSASSASYWDTEIQGWLRAYWFAGAALALGLSFVPVVCWLLNLNKRKRNPAIARVSGVSASGAELPWPALIDAMTDHGDALTRNIQTQIASLTEVLGRQLKDIKGSDPALQTLQREMKESLAWTISGIDSVLKNMELLIGDRAKLGSDLSLLSANLGEFYREHARSATLAAPSILALGQVHNQALVGAQKLYEHRDGIDQVFAGIVAALDTLAVGRADDAPASECGGYQIKELRAKVATYRSTLSTQLAKIGQAHNDNMNLSFREPTEQSLHSLTDYTRAVFQTIRDVSDTFVSVGNGSAELLVETAARLREARQAERQARDRAGQLETQLGEERAQSESARHDFEARLGASEAARKGLEVQRQDLLEDRRYLIQDLIASGYLEAEFTADNGTSLVKVPDEIKALYRSDAESRPELQAYVRTLISLRVYLETPRAKALHYFEAARLSDILAALNTKASFLTLYRSTAPGDSLLGQWDQLVQRIYRAALLLDSYWRDQTDPALRGRLEQCQVTAALVLGRYAGVRPHALTLPVDRQWVQERRSWVCETQEQGVPAALEAELAFRQRVFGPSQERPIYCDVATWGYDPVDGAVPGAALLRMSALVAKEAGSKWLPER